MTDKVCTHFDWRGAEPVTLRTQGCEECAAAGSSWQNLRVCLTCGHVGCCDTSPGRHATQHFEATRHHVMQSLEAKELWGWCYTDQTYLNLRRRMYGAEE